MVGRFRLPCLYAPCKGAEAPLASVGCTGQSTLRILEVTAERSSRGPVTHHLLPSSLQAPAVSSVLVLPKHLCGAGQPGHSQVHSTGFGDKGPPEPVTPWGATPQREHGRRQQQQPASAHTPAQGSSQKGWWGVKLTYIKLGHAALRCESLAQPPKLPLQTCCPLPVSKMLHLQLGLPGRSQRGCREARVELQHFDDENRTGETLVSGRSLNHQGEGGEGFWEQVPSSWRLGARAARRFWLPGKISQHIDGGSYQHNYSRIIFVVRL